MKTNEPFAKQGHTVEIAKRLECGVSRRFWPRFRLRTPLAVKFAGLLLALLLGCASQAHAGSIVWTNASGGSWGTPANWSPNQVPGPPDDAAITMNGTYTVTLSASATVRSLTLGGGSGLQTLTNNGNALTFTNPSVVNASGALGWSAGTLSGSNLTLSGTMNWASGTVASPLTVAGGGVLNLLGTTTMYLGSALTNAGTVNWTGGSLYLNSCSYAPGPVVNLPGGLWTVQCDQYLYYNCALPASGYFLNLGTIQKKAGTGTTYIYLPFDNLGAVAGLAGTLSFYDGGTIAGSYSAASGAVIGFSSGSFSNAAPPALSGSGAIQFTGGSLSLVNDIIPGLQLTGGTVTLAPGFQGGVITNLTLSGSTLSGTNTVTGTMNWASGTVAGPLTVAGSGVLNLLGTSPMYLGSALTNAGTVNWTGGGLYLNSCRLLPPGR